MKLTQIILTLIRYPFNFLGERKFHYWDFLIVALYAGLTGFIIFYHEPWSDEAYPWLIARDANLQTFLNIAAHNYDRHPVFFHLCLMPMAKLGLPYFSQAVFNWCLAVAAVLIFFIWAPFSRITKCVFILSYYMMFEYAVVVRPYTLAILLIFIIATLYPQRFKIPIRYAIVVFLLFHTENICFAIAASMTALFGFELLREKRYDRWTLGALLIMIIGGLLAFVQGFLLPPDHMDYHTFKMIGYDNALRAVQKTFFPFSLSYTLADTFSIDIIIGILIIASAILSLVKRPIALFVLLCAYAELFGIFIFAHRGDLRHFGFVYISILFAFWIGQYYEELGRKTKMAVRTWFSWLFSSQFFRILSLSLINVCILFSVKGVLFSYVLDYHFLFSGGKPMASVINQLFKERGLAQQHYVIVAKETGTASLLPYMPDKKFWNPCIRDYLTYYLAKKEIADCCDLPDLEMIVRAEKKFGDLRRVLFLVGKPLQISDYNDYRFDLVTSVDRGMFGYCYEKYYLYRPIQKTTSL